MKDYHLGQEHKALKQLTDYQLEQLIDAYYAGTEADELMAQYEIIDTKRHLYQLFPTLISNTGCTFCGGQVQANYLEYHNINRITTWTCIDCGHKFHPACTCQNCTSLQKQHQQQYLESKIAAHYSLEHFQPIMLTELTEADRYVIEDLLNKYWHSDDNYLYNISQLIDVVSLELLMEKGLIIPHEKTSYQSFELVDDVPAIKELAETYFTFNLCTSSNPHERITIKQISKYLSALNDTLHMEENILSNPMPITDGSEEAAAPVESSTIPETPIETVTLPRNRRERNQALYQKQQSPFEKYYKRAGELVDSLKKGLNKSDAGSNTENETDTSTDE